jgi:hypothetical protein
MDAKSLSMYLSIVKQILTVLSNILQTILVTA